MEPAFTGFSPHSLAFFEGLAANNNKAWFEAHQGDYWEFFSIQSSISDLNC